MNPSYLYQTDADTQCIVLFILMILAVLAGKKFAKTKLKLDGGNISSMTSALLALLAFILGFTYSMSNQRYDVRKDLIIQESNCIGTAILRADLFVDSIRTPLRADFKDYLEARIAFYEAKSNVKEILAEMAKGREISAKIWDRIAYVNRTAPNVASAAAMNAVNDMIDIEAERFYKSIARVPDSIITLLFLLCLAAAFFTGCQAANYKGLQLVMPFVLQFMLTLVIYITLDLDRPRRGLITMDEIHKSMIDLRENFDSK
jgi:hypothetical protein